ncbi:hypothetical protein PsAD2_01049 [Pseudovibrio axinellae]|uniref:Uncharacterized protein n=1 Tax=Pseudovibrio axinellae TaxID=989403 RepID=A0A166AH13_9HYPH|nr:hypothetical protein [Pseudovibrio axinellae]KZL21057.1 hypothetical protein PsAD2_01049 [Pseudovibrio axinellae]SEP77144.1 hypothetical protein SAMN05421798_101352 [Pseudovibrio axinellae]
MKILSASFALLLATSSFAIAKDQVNVDEMKELLITELRANNCEIKFPDLMKILQSKGFTPAKNEATGKSDFDIVQDAITQLDDENKADTQARTLILTDGSC